MTASNHTETFRIVSTMCDEWKLRGSERLYVIRRAGQLIDRLSAHQAFNQALVEHFDWVSRMASEI